MRRMTSQARPAAIPRSDAIVIDDASRPTSRAAVMLPACEAAAPMSAVARTMVSTSVSADSIVRMVPE